MCGLGKKKVFITNLCWKKTTKKDIEEVVN